MTPSPARTVARFHDFELDVAACELRRRGRRLRLARQPMDLLMLLIERPQALVTRAEIARRLWREDVFVDVDAGIHTTILRIRQALGDSRDTPRYVETVPGRGYRFIAPVELISLPDWSASPAPARSPVPRRDNLPADLTTFVGRRRELDELSRLLASSRLLTLTGAGGVGKTRLALRLAAEGGDAFADGAWLVDLTPLSRPDLLAPTIAATLGIREGAQRPVREALPDALRERELLLVLDNCEHLIRPCAELVEAVLRHAGSLRIVATSREALGLPGETVFRVPSLSLPGARTPVLPAALREYEATRLFVERAAATDPGFAPSPAHGAAVARICHRLDGIPLAIELAAARVAVLTLEQIESRLDDRFRLLTSSARTVVARQRTLEATVEWSYQLLSDTERHLLDRLSVFAAGWTLDAAECVCGGDGIATQDVLDVLSRLVGKSLVTPDGDLHGARRYRLLETIRQYARDRLDASGALGHVRDRHFLYFHGAYRGVLPILRGHGQLPCLERLRAEQENLRAALEWGVSTPAFADEALDLAGALFWFWTKTGQFAEGRLWLERALAGAAAASGRLRARALIGLAHMHYFEGHYADAAAVVDEALRIGRAEGDWWAVSFARFLQGLAAFERGQLDEAAAHATDARTAADAAGEAVQHGGPLLVLANVAVLRGDHDRAGQLFDESIDVHRRAGDSWGLGILLSAAAGLRIIRGEMDHARTQAAEALALGQSLDDPRGIAWSLDVCAGLLATGGQADDAARLWGAADGLLDTVGGSLPPTIRWIRDHRIDSVRTTLGAESFAIAYADGRVLAAEEAIALARQQALLLP